MRKLMIKKIYYKIEPIFPPIKIVKKIYRKWRGPKRYKYLFEIIKNNRCKRIMEVGTWDGEHASQMIKVAKKNFRPEETEYYGFDLFELLNDEMAQEEYALIPPNLEKVENRLEKTKAKIHLYRGNTNDTLPKVINKLPKMDFVFIDGGHSLETVQNDWKYVQQVMGYHTVVIFDDYWNREDLGCKKVVEGIDRGKFKVNIVPIQDRFKTKQGILTINLVQVQKINSRPDGKN